MDLLPSSPLGQRFCETFCYLWASLEGTTQPNIRAKWRTIRKYPLRPRTLWERYLDPSQLVGVRFGRDTKYGMLDIDAGSVYLDKLGEITAALETIGIVRSVPVRSSASGGLHLYIPLPEAVATFSLACALRQCLEGQGLEIKPGQLEIFPNVKSYAKHWLGEFTEYNGHRLPLQSGTGAAILANDLSPVGDDLPHFFALWDNAAMQQDGDEIRQALACARNNHRKRPRRKNCNPVATWRTDLENEINAGWSGPGQTNGLLKSIACYGHVFEALEGPALAQYVERIAKTRPGYLDHCSHQRDIEAKAKAWANAAQRYYWPLGTSPARSVATCNPNADRRADARQRIAIAAAELRLNAPATIRAWVDQLVELAKCSTQTLYRHLDLWHPEPPVTAQPAGDTAPPPPPSALFPWNAEGLTNSGVTGGSPLNEGCSLKNSPKIYLPKGGEGGPGGRGEISTGSYA